MPLPAFPADGVIESLSLADGVGAIRLADGGEVRFGRSACGFEPAVGATVRVLGVKPGLAGKVRATRVELGGDPEAHAVLVDARDRAAGKMAACPPSDPRVIPLVKIALTLARPLVDRGELRAWWAATGVGGLDLTRWPIASVRGHRFEVKFGSGASRAALDTRAAPVGASVGDGFITFFDGEPGDEEAREERDELGYPDEPYVPRPRRGPSRWGFADSGNARDLLGLVDRLAARGAGVTGVVISAAGGLWLPPAAWRQRCGDLDDETRYPVEALLDVAYGAPDAAGVRRIRSFGMYRGLALPEVEVDDPVAATDDARHELAEHAAWIACRVLAGEDAKSGRAPEATFPTGSRPRIGPLSFRVVAHVVVDEVPMVRIADVELTRETGRP